MAKFVTQIVNAPFLATAIPALYRFGFNGQEKVDEVAGPDNHYTAKHWEYYPRDVKRWNLEPLFKDYPSQSNYVVFRNSPILFHDNDGQDARVSVQHDPAGGKIIIQCTIYITGEGANKFNANVYTQKAAKNLPLRSFAKSKNEKYTIEFDIKYQYVEDKSAIKMKAGDNIIEYNNREMRSETGGRYTIADGVVTRYTGNSAEISDENSVGATWKPTVHETLHLIGLSDRYADNPKGGESIPDVGFEDDFMGSYWGTELNQIHYDNWGNVLSQNGEGTSILTERVDTRKTDGSLIGGSSDGKRPVSGGKAPNDANGSGNSNNPGNASGSTSGQKN